MLSGRSLSLVDGWLDAGATTLRRRRGHLTADAAGGDHGALLTRVPAAFHGGINDVLLTALAVAVADWCRRRGPRRSAARC